MKAKIKNAIKHLKNTLKKPIPGMEKVYIPIATRSDDDSIILFWAKDIELLKELAIKQRIELEVSYKQFSYWGAKYLRQSTIEVYRKGKNEVGIR